MRLFNQTATVFSRTVDGVMATLAKLGGVLPISTVAEVTALPVSVPSSGVTMT